MKSKEYYISLILSHAEELKQNFGVKSLRLFGFCVPKRTERRKRCGCLRRYGTEDVSGCQTQTFLGKPPSVFCRYCQNTQTHQPLSFERNRT